MSIANVLYHVCVHTMDCIVHKFIQPASHQVYDMNILYVTAVVRMG